MIHLFSSIFGQVVILIALHLSERLLISVKLDPQFLVVFSLLEEFLKALPLVVLVVFISHRQIIVVSYCAVLDFHLPELCLLKFHPCHVIVEFLFMLLIRFEGLANTCLGFELLDSLFFSLALGSLFLSHRHPVLDINLLSNFRLFQSLFYLIRKVFALLMYLFNHISDVLTCQLIELLHQLLLFKFICC